MRSAISFNLLEGGTLVKGSSILEAADGATLEFGLDYARPQPLDYTGIVIAVCQVMVQS